LEPAPDIIEEKYSSGEINWSVLSVTEKVVDFGNC
jgi:hypothetical protein